MTAIATTKPSAERELVITRVFDAPRSLVFKMWTDPKQVAQWWGPKGFTNPVCELDVRPGGAIRIVMRGPNGIDYPMTGVFHEIVEPERLVLTTAVDDADGNRVLEVLNTATFAERGGKTTLTLQARVVIATATAAAMLAGMEAGWTQSLERLAEHVAHAGATGMQPHKIVSREEWVTARKAHLANEKKLTRARDELARERRDLPWVKVDKEYVFDTPDGKKTLADLFDGRSQLIIHHFMWRWDLGQGCVGCSFEADHAEGAVVHLENHDVTYVRVSRAPLTELEVYKKRMGWRAKWVSSYGSDFNYDYHVSFTKDELAKGKVHYNYAMTEHGFDELPGLSVFYKDHAGAVFHTYSSYARGNEEAIGTFIYLDITPKGRNETEIMDWVKRHDEYDAADGAQSCCHAAERA